MDDNKIKICEALNCKKKATVKFGPTRLCAECYTSVAYDWKPLALKRKNNT